MHNPRMFRFLAPCVHPVWACLLGHACKSPLSTHLTRPPCTPLKVGITLVPGWQRSDRYCHSCYQLLVAWFGVGEELVAWPGAVGSCAARQDSVPQPT